MENKQYKTVMGFIVPGTSNKQNPQFKTTKTGKEFANVLVKDCIKDQLFSVTIWENELDYVRPHLEVGAILFAEGTYDQFKNTEGKIFHNVSANKLNIVPALGSGPVKQSDYEEAAQALEF